MTTPTPQPRGYLAAFIDRLFSRFLGLPSETSSYSTTTLNIPLPSSLSLAATLFTPTSPSQGLLVSLTPYPRTGPIAISSAHIYAARGYNVLLISCRGTSGSTGTLNPAITEREDFTAVLPWVRQQPWYPGKFATIGASYTTFTQFALFSQEWVEDCVGMVASIGPHDFAQHHWGTGAFRLDRIGWADLILNQEDPTLSMFRRMHRVATTGKRLKPVYDALPVVDAVQAFFPEGKVDWLLQSMREDDINGKYWAEARHGDALNRIECPVFLTTGWMDLFFYQTMEQYQRLRARGVDVKLVVGNWTHMQVSGNVAGDTVKWLDKHVAGKETMGEEVKAVRVFVTGAEEWREMEVWPPQTRRRVLNLLPGQTLGVKEEEVSTNDAPPSQFVYDPADPTPTMGGPRLALGGKVNDSALAARQDVLSFTTPVLEEDVEVLGPPVVELLHQSDNPHADLFVRLCEVDVRGRSWNITETFKRFGNRAEKDKVVLEIPDVGHRFKKGCKIRLLVAGGNFPMYSRNLGTGENGCKGKAIKTAAHTIFHGEEGVSRVVLPVAA